MFHSTTSGVQKITAGNRVAKEEIEIFGLRLLYLRPSISNNKPFSGFVRLHNNKHYCELNFIKRISRHNGKGQLPPPKRWGLVTLLHMVLTISINSPISNVGYNTVIDTTAT